MQHSPLIVLTIFYQMYRYLPTGPNKFKVLKTLKNMKEMLLVKSNSNCISNSNSRFNVINIEKGYD